MRGWLGLWHDIVLLRCHLLHEVLLTRDLGGLLVGVFLLTVTSKVLLAHLLDEGSIFSAYWGKAAPSRETCRVLKIIGGLSEHWLLGNRALTHFLQIAQSLHDLVIFFLELLESR